MDKHIPVLLDESIEYLNIKSNDIVVDATAGGGGHSKVILEKLGPEGVLVLIDFDSSSLIEAHRELSTIPRKTELFVVENNFKNLSQILSDHKIKKPTKLIFDLGWNSMQLSSGRGFSFKKEEPLLMTYSSNEDNYIFTAKDIVNSWDEINIADIIYHYGEERFSRRIAKAIVEKRKTEEIKTSVQLAEIIRKAYPAIARWRGGIHPATKTFQAIRMVVNDEIRALKTVLADIPSISADNSIIAFITFHSIEDRIIKHTFKDWEKKGEGTIITKKPIRPTQVEIDTNPRCRSAKLRIFNKQKYDH